MTQQQQHGYRDAEIKPYCSCGKAADRNCRTCVNLNTDRANCGACGRDCGGAACESGICGWDCGGSPYVDCDAGVVYPDAGADGAVDGATDQ